MSTEKYEVKNVTPGVVTFIVHPVADPEVYESVPKHKRRKMLKGNPIMVKIPSQTSVDLCEVTGMGIEELKLQPQLNAILASTPTKLITLGELTGIDVKAPLKKPAPKPAKKAVKKPVEKKTVPHVEAKPEPPKEEPKKEEPKVGEGI